MKFRSWLSTCSTTAADFASPSPPPKSPPSDTSSPFSSSSITSSSIQSNLSLLTHPSVSSLQKLTLPAETAALHSSATSVFLTSVKPKNRRAGINFLALRKNLLYVVSGNEINVYEIMDNTLFNTFNIGNVSTGSVKSIAFRDGKVFTAHQDCKIRVWKPSDQKQHKLVATLPTLEDRLRRFILPQNYINVRRHKKKLWIEHHDAVSGLATGQNENLVVSISWDKSIKIWEPRNFRCLETINKAHDDAINAVTISKDGLIYTGSADKRIKVWRKEGKRYGAIATLEKHKSAVNALALNEEGTVLFSGSRDRSILVWEREESANHMAVVGALRGHAKAILCLMVTAGDLLLSGSGDGTVRIWQRGCCLKVLEGHQTPVKSLVAITETGGDGAGVKVFSGSFDGEIKVWQILVCPI